MGRGEATQDGDEDAAAADDHFGAIPGQPRIVDPVRQGFGDQGAKDVLGRGSGQLETVDRCGVVFG